MRFQKYFNDYAIVILLILVTVLLCFIGIVSFLQPALLPALALGNRPSEIGEALNGLTAPVIGLLTAGLLYFSFRQQYRANEIQRQAIDRQVFTGNFTITYQLLTEAEEIFRSIEYTPDENIRYKGVSAIKNLRATVKDYGQTRYASDTCHDEITLALRHFKIILTRIENSSFDSNDFRLLYEKADAMWRHYVSEIDEHISDAKSTILATDTQDETIRNGLAMTAIRLDRINKRAHDIIETLIRLSNRAETVSETRTS